MTFLVSKGLLCLYDKLNNTWLLVDMAFLFSWSDQHWAKNWKRNSIFTAPMYYSPFIKPCVCVFQSLGLWQITQTDRQIDRKIGSLRQHVAIDIAPTIFVMINVFFHPEHFTIFILGLLIIIFLWSALYILHQMEC